MTLPALQCRRLPTKRIAKAKRYRVPQPHETVPVHPAITLRWANGRHIRDTCSAPRDSHPARASHLSRAEADAAYVLPHPPMARETTRLM